MDTLKTLTYDVTGRIARITLNRPERGNGKTWRCSAAAKAYIAQATRGGCSPGMSTGIGSPLYVPGRGTTALQSVGPTRDTPSFGAVPILLAGPCRLPEAGPFGAQKNELVHLGCQDPRAAGGCLFGDPWEQSL